MRSCCFIGHRKVPDRDRIYAIVKKTVAELIVKEHVRYFNFGSKSEFDDLCHLAVSELQNEYPDIVRVNYNRKSEYVVKKSEKERLEEIGSSITKEKVVLKDFDDSKISDKVKRAGKASYVERNREMIDDSDFCVFFYTPEYKPNTNPRYPSSGKSGTRLAYDYAAAKNKVIINAADLE